MISTKKNVLASRVAGKRSSGLLKLCSVLGLSFPVAKSHFMEHLKVFEEKAYSYCVMKILKKLHHEHEIWRLENKN